MAIISEEPLENLEKRILARLDIADQSDMKNLIRNVILFIKRIHGELLSDVEKKFPPHFQFSHIQTSGGQNTAKALYHRLQLIDRYQLDKPALIEDVLTNNLPIGSEVPLSARKAQILWQLNHDPTLPKYKLAKKVGTTPRTISKDLAELEQNYAFRIYTSVDPHRFHLIMKMIFFKTKSIEHTKKFERYVTRHRGFLRTYRIDQDMQRGAIIFRYPNQHRAHRMFDERVRWLQDEFFTECNLVQALGLHQSVSLEMYNPSTHTFSIEPEIVSQVPFDYGSSSLDTLPQPRGFDFMEPFWFDQADFLIVDMLYSSGLFSHPDYKQSLLKRYGINYSKKSIWKKEQRLRKEKAGFPTIGLQIPAFDEELVIVVFCTLSATLSIQAISAFLPFVMIVKTDSGCVLRIQRPVHSATLTAQLIRKIHRQIGVTEVKLLRYPDRLPSQYFPGMVERWNTANQKWEIQVGDI
ncbi:MAG: HTH domain-containing protein [Promethearchaeota archaeon]